VEAKNNQNRIKKGGFFMRRKVLSCFVALAMVVSLFATLPVAAGAESGETGSPQLTDLSEEFCSVPECPTTLAEGGFGQPVEINGVLYYEISTPEQLAHINEHLDLNYIQTADIDLSEYNSGEPDEGLWTPIALTDPDLFVFSAGFSGTYNGNDKTISNLRIEFINTEETDGDPYGPDGQIAAGLFGILEYGALIENVNLTVTGIKIYYENYYITAGGICGYNKGASIRNCLVTYEGDMEISGALDGSLGGISGFNTFDFYIEDPSEIESITSAISINNCEARFEDGSIIVNSGFVTSGGISGSTVMSTTGCHVFIDEDESIQGVSVGGISAIGYPYFEYRTFTISDCSVRGSGSIVALPDVSLYSYNMAGGRSSAGGIIAIGYEAQIENCYNEVEVIADIDPTEFYPSEDPFIPKPVYAGGIAGYLDSGSSLFRCDNTGDVIASQVMPELPESLPGGEMTVMEVAYDEPYAYAGGIAGYVNGFYMGVSIENCQNEANVSANNTYPYMRAYAGGVTGHIDIYGGYFTRMDAGLSEEDDIYGDWVIVKNCANKGKIKEVRAVASTAMAGGISASTTFAYFGGEPAIQVVNCYNEASVYSENNGPMEKEALCVGITAGGIIGAAGEVIVDNCYSHADNIVALSEAGAEYSGGLFGIIYNTIASNNYYEINGKLTRAVGGTANEETLQIDPQDDVTGEFEGKTPSELRNRDTFISWPWYESGGTAPDYYSSENPWRFTEKDGYPVLRGKPYTSSGGRRSGGSSYYGPQAAATYTITATANEGGTITPSGTVEVIENSDITFTMVPGNHFKIKDVLVDGESVGAVSEYTFTSVRSNHTIEAIFALDCPSEAYVDVDITKWYHEPIDFVLLAGLFKGITESTFEPDSAMTRSMMVAVLYRLGGSPAVTGEIPFPDVEPGSWYADAILWSEANEIVEGYDNGMFGPHDPITREQLAAILYRYAQYKGYDVSIGEETNILSYEDAFDISDYAVPAMQWAVGAGIIQGDGAHLNPREYASRAQVAAMVMRFIENVAK